MLQQLLIAAIAATMIVHPTEARVNSTGAIGTFMITSCDDCTKDKNSIFCTAGADGDFVANATYKITIKQKKALLGASEGSKYCWSGTFGKLVEPVGHFDSKLEEANVTSSLTCAQDSLFYRQCVLNAQLAVVLISIGTIVFVLGCTCCCFYCGCCKCCNNKGDESKWGMCNRFCPHAPCADPPEKEEVLSHSAYNPESEEEHASSLFGRNNKLNEITKRQSFGDLKKPGESPSASPAFATVNPVTRSAV